jgi:hypothetical protein
MRKYKPDKFGDFVDFWISVFTKVLLILLFINLLNAFAKYCIFH